MKKNIFVILVIIMILLIIYLIILKFNTNTKTLKTNTNIEDKINNYKVTKKIDVIINDKNYTLNLEDNSTTKELINNLPFDFNMKELNGNEKYIYMDKTYPTNISNPGHINKGDVMLYEDNCLVIFYESFDTTYQYTKLGHIDNLDDLDSKDINVKFKIQ